MNFFDKFSVRRLASVYLRCQEAVLTLPTCKENSGSTPVQGKKSETNSVAKEPKGNGNE
jgi:hypothetical protein